MMTKTRTPRRLVHGASRDRPRCFTDERLAAPRRAAAVEQPSSRRPSQRGRANRQLDLAARNPQGPHRVPLRHSVIQWHI